jgi:hypothetical protein
LYPAPIFDLWSPAMSSAGQIGGIAGTLEAAHKVAYVSFLQTAWQ